MPPVRSDRHVLSSAVRLLSARGTLLVVGVLALAFAVFAGIDATTEKPTDGTVWLLGRPELVILDVSVREGVPLSQLQKGDRILGIANQLVRTPADAVHILQQQKPGSTVNYLIDRDGRNLVVPVELTVIRMVDRNYIINIVLAVIYLGIGFLVYLRSGNDRPARLFFLLCLAFGIYFMTNLNRTSYFWGDIITQNGGAFVRFMVPALFLQFFLSFPEKKLVLTRHPFLSPLVYLLPIMFYVQFTIDQFFGSEGANIRAVHWVVLILYYIFGLAALVHGYFNYRDPIQKERVRLLTLGTLTGVLPFLIFKIGLEELGARSELTDLGMIPLVAIPISFGYCIARYRVMQIDFFLKRSLVYSLLTGFVLLAYLFLVLALGGIILQLSGPTSQLVSVGATLAIAAGLWPVRSRVQRIVDRKFFRSRENLAGILEEFSKEIPQLIQRDALLKSVGQRLCDVLELPTLGVYLSCPDVGHGHWCMQEQIVALQGKHAESSGRIEGDTREVSSTHDASSTRDASSTSDAPGSHLARVKIFPREMDIEATTKQIERRSEPYWVEPLATGGMSNQLAITQEQAEMAARFAEQEKLAHAGIELLVPLATQGRLIGLLALPAKPTGEDYQLAEVQLLTIVAGQVALQIENSRLYAQEVAKQKLEEELAMARTIQARLLPTEIPVLPGATLHAVNISSRQVSGDYYDMIQREDGSLGIVIADVSGKGMPASLLASNLQAALRAQIDLDISPSVILGRINRQLHASTDPQHFATLFLCIYDPAGHKLTYCSGGHNAPVVLRSNGRIELLEKGGLPLGAFDFGSYEEGEITLEPGDLLFLYTDGLTETKDSTESDEYGEERLNQFLLQYGSLPVNHLIERVNDELKLFSGRDDADDDITLVALKINEKAHEVADEAAARGN